MDVTRANSGLSMPVTGAGESQDREQAIDEVMVSAPDLVARLEAASRVAIILTCIIPRRGGVALPLIPLVWRGLVWLVLARRALSCVAVT
jgi:hypothetical protein